MGGKTVRVPIARGRGLSAAPDQDGRFRAIAALQAPVATCYITTTGAITIWLPWAHIEDPQRSELVALLNGVLHHLYLLNAGPAQIVTLPTEHVVVGSRVINAARSPAQASLVGPLRMRPAAWWRNLRRR